MVSEKFFRDEHAVFWLLGHSMEYIHALIQLTESSLELLFDYIYDLIFYHSYNCFFRFAFLTESEKH